LEDDERVAFVHLQSPNGYYLHYELIALFFHDLQSYHYQKMSHDPHGYEFYENLEQV
jgi:hypothetical protein